MNLKNYPGSKSGSGIIQFLINNIPAHKRYFEFFAGSAKLFKAKRAAKTSILADIDKDVTTCLFNDIGRNAFIYAESVFEMIAKYSHSWILDGFSRSDFIYLDPPYPFSSRRAGRKYYKYEMNDQDHKKLLATI